MTRIEQFGWRGPVEPGIGSVDFAPVATWANRSGADAEVGRFPSRSAWRMRKRTVRGETQSVLSR